METLVDRFGTELADHAYRPFTFCTLSLRDADATRDWRVVCTCMVERCPRMRMWCWGDPEQEWGTT